MPKVTVVQIVYNNRRFIEPVFSAIFVQTFKDFNVVAVISGNDDGGKELLMEKFPQVEIIDPGFNIGFAGGHNLVFEKYGANLSVPQMHSGHLPSKGERLQTASAVFPPLMRGGIKGEVAEFFQLVNPDMIIEPTYIEEMLKVFTDEKVGASTGKLYQAPADIIAAGSSNLKSYILNHKYLDTTGVTISKSGRARDRGQHEVGRGQYDKLTAVDAVSGAGCMYRREALEAVKCQRLNVKGQYEYFDEDFHSYWEDVDLSWRMVNAGWKNIFVPTAVGYHGRAAGSSRGGYLHLVDFIKHHRALPQRVLDLNYKNHIFMYLKNSKFFYPQFFIREFFMFWYILFFETRTLKVIPEMFKLLPVMWKKRKDSFNYGK